MIARAGNLLAADINYIAVASGFFSWPDLTAYVINPPVEEWATVRGELGVRHEAASCRKPPKKSHCVGRRLNQRLPFVNFVYRQLRPYHAVGAVTSIVRRPQNRVVVVEARTLRPHQQSSRRTAVRAATLAAAILALATRCCCHANLYVRSYVIFRYIVFTIFCIIII